MSTSADTIQTYLDPLLYMNSPFLTPVYLTLLKLMPSEKKYITCNQCFIFEA